MINWIFRKIRNAYAKLDNKYSCYKRRRKLKNRDFSIISNNCWGGLISQYYGLPYMSPTCGLLIGGIDYIKFCRNIKYYLSIKLEFINFEDAKFRHQYQGFKPFPVARLDDIEIYFIHYHSEEEAAEKWYRRTKRINWDNIIFKISHRESFTNEDIEVFAALDLPNKLIIAEKGNTYKTVIIPGISTYVGDETPLIFEHLDVTEYLNSLTEK